MGFIRTMNAPTKREYSTAKSNARRRGIAWFLSYQEWCDVWVQSGKYAQRGRGRGEYQMDRKRPECGYDPDNVQIIDGALNRTKDRPHGWNAKLNAEKVDEIRRLYCPRITTKRHLALKYSVSTACIKAILSGTNWRPHGQP